jgi:ABC-2 type transport system permease protein
MKDMITILKYTIKENITKKAFIITTIILMTMIILICNIPNIINLFESSEEEVIENVKFAVIDEYNLMGEELTALSEMGKAMYWDIEIKDKASEETIEQVRNDELMGIVEVLKNEETGMVKLKYTSKGSIYTDDQSIISQFASMLKTIQVNKELVNSNVSLDTINMINSEIEFETKHLEDENDNFLVAMAASFILFFAVYFYGNTVAVSVSSEKTSRVMETLVTSTTPRNIIIGKTAAMGIVGLGQMILLIVTAFASYKLFIPAEMDVISSMIENININVTSIAICIIYFILGYTVYAFLNAVTGATVSKVEDLNSAQTPIALISLASFYLAYFTATVPDSSASKFASIFPFSSAFSMPGRILAGGATSAEIATSIALLIATATLLAFISIKVYSGAVLHYGKRLNIKELLKLTKEK